MKLTTVSLRTLNDDTSKLQSIAFAQFRSNDSNIIGILASQLVDNLSSVIQTKIRKNHLS